MNRREGFEAEAETINLEQEGGRMIKDNLASKEIDQG
jgi:hypothetical protein